MTDTKTDNTSRKPRIVLGPVASGLLEDVPTSERSAFLDTFIVRAQEARPAADGAVGSLSEEVPRRIGQLTEAIIESHNMQDDLIAAFQEGLKFILEECKHTRGLIGTELLDGDDRLALIERLEAVTDTREANANAVAAGLGLANAQRRRVLEQTMENLAPVVTDARDPEQDTELRDAPAKGVER